MPIAVGLRLLAIWSNWDDIDNTECVQGKEQGR